MKTDTMSTINLDFFANRASVRVFSDRPVNEDTVERIIEAAAHASTTGNMQLYSVIVTRNAENREKLAALHLNQPAATGAPVLLTICADIRRFAQWCAARDARSGLDNPGGWLSAITDASIFGQQIVTAAESIGLGCCFLGSAAYNIEGFCDALGLPDGVLPLVGIAMGYPAAEVKPNPDRLPLDAIMHKERYHDPLPDEIDRYYAYKEAMPESEVFIKENHKKTLAQVFAEVRYPASLNEAVGREVMARIAKETDV